MRRRLLIGWPVLRKVWSSRPLGIVSGPVLDIRITAFFISRSNVGLPLRPITMANVWTPCLAPFQPAGGDWSSAGICPARARSVLCFVRRIPTGFDLPAQGCEERATLGPWSTKNSTLSGVESNARYQHSACMPQSLAKILVHTVFSTKDRRPSLRDQVLRKESHRYLGGILTHLDCQPLMVGGRGRSRPPSVCPVAHLRCGDDGKGGQTRLIAVAEKQGPGLAGLCVAKRLWHFLRRLFATRSRAGLYRRAGRASSEDFVSG